MFWKKANSGNYKVKFGHLVEKLITDLRATLDEGPGSNFIGTNLD
jgi:hypothetical protein